MVLITLALIKKVLKMRSNSKVSIFALLVSVMVISGCGSSSAVEHPVATPAPTYQPQVVQTKVVKAPVVQTPKIEVVDAVIREGVTSRTEVLAVLGKPQALGKSDYGDMQLMYKFEKNSQKAVKLTYYDKDGHDYEFYYPYDDTDHGINELWILIDNNSLVSGVETL